MENYSPSQPISIVTEDESPSFSGPIPLPDSMFESGVLNWREGDDAATADTREQDTDADRTPATLLRLLRDLFRRKAVPSGTIQILAVLGALLLVALAQAMGREGSIL